MPGSPGPPSTGHHTLAKAEGIHRRIKSTSLLYKAPKAEGGSTAALEVEVGSGWEDGSWSGAPYPRTAEATSRHLPTLVQQKVWPEATLRADWEL